MIAPEALAQFPLEDRRLFVESVLIAQEAADRLAIRAGVPELDGLTGLITAAGMLLAVRAEGKQDELLAEVAAARASYEGETHG